MPKHEYNSFVETIDHNISHGVEKEVLHLTTANVSNSTINIEDNDLINFSSYSYLNLENHPNLVSGCSKALKKYGTQFGFSRAYVSLEIYTKLEENLSKLFGYKTIVAQSTTLAHQSVIPTIINDNDLLILDQYAHASIQTSVKILTDRGVKIEMVRHNRIDLLEKKILESRNKHDRIWYFADGVYSMHGNYARLNEIEHLLTKYKQFHFFVDDAHGMSWTGVNGKGYVLSQMDLHYRMIVITSMNKAFASSGGAIIVRNDEWYRKIKNCGGPLIFSTPIPPPMLGAAIGSSELHLSAAFPNIQMDLKKKIDHCISIIEKEELPEISENNSPIFFIPCSLPSVCFTLSKRMIDKGFYVTPTMFPAVGSKHAGIRFCINANHSIFQIESMVRMLKKLYYEVLEEHSVTVSQILKNFSKLQHTEPILKAPELNSKYKVTWFRTIDEIDEHEWNNIFKHEGIFDWNGLKLIEEIFTENKESHHNWEFFYLIVRNEINEVIAATFLTLGLTKDDLFEQESISKIVEDIRKKDPYYLCSKTLMMGNQVSEGKHLFIDRSYDNPRLMELILREITSLQNQIGAENIVLRDFEINYHHSDLLIDYGYVKFKLPADTHIMMTDGWINTEEYLNTLKKKKRQQIKRDVLAFEPLFDIQFLEQVPKSELPHFYELYLQVKSAKYLINTFNLPFKFFELVNSDKNWEMIVLSIKNEKNIPHPVGVVWCKKGDEIYTPLFIGLDYEYSRQYKVYKQAMWQIIKRAKAIGSKRLYLGVTASLEKRRFGAQPVEREAYLQMNDTYNLDLLHSQGFKNYDHDLVE